MGERWNEKLAKLRASLVGKGHLRIQPRHRISGPFGSMEADIERTGLLSDERCVDCGFRVVKASGPLIAGRCGACNLASLGDGDTQPAA